jgi:hypothetical protein
LITWNTTPRQNSCVSFFKITTIFLTIFKWYFLNWRIRRYISMLGLCLWFVKYRYNAIPCPHHSFLPASCSCCLLMKCFVIALTEICTKFLNRSTRIKHIQYILLGLTKFVSSCVNSTIFLSNISNEVLNCARQHN